MHNQDQKQMQIPSLTRPNRAHPEMTALLKTFKLEHKLSYWPYDVVTDQVVAGAYACASNGEMLVIEFLLSVWDQHMDWRELGYRNFNLVHAMGTWGYPSRSVAAVSGWMAKPFFP